MALFRSRTPKQSPSSGGRFRPRVEALEARDVPAVTCIHPGPLAATSPPPQDRAMAGQLGGAADTSGAPRAALAGPEHGRILRHFAEAPRRGARLERENAAGRYSLDEAGRLYKDPRGQFVVWKSGQVSMGPAGLYYDIYILPPVRGGTWDPARFRSASDIPGDPPTDPIERSLVKVTQAVSGPLCPKRGPESHAGTVGLSPAESHPDETLASGSVAAGRPTHHGESEPAVDRAPRLRVPNAWQWNWDPGFVIPLGQTSWHGRWTGGRDLPPRE
jgi:hypothetical protein